MKNIVILASVLFLAYGCSSQKTTTSNNTSEVEASTEGRKSRKGPRSGPRSVEDVFKMDTNNDNQLSKEEIKGPLADRFEEIDTDKDGFISKSEFENAPKPQRGQRPPRGQR